MRDGILQRTLRPCLLLVPLLIGGSLALSGCQKKAQDEQLVAAGKSFEVTVPELDQLLRQSPAVSREEVVPARQKLLDVLINQKLFADAAIEQKLDRDADTMQELEAERRRVLASAYVTHLFTSLAKPTSREVQAYYDAHPKTFGQRKVFTINQVSISGENLPLREFQAALEAGGMAGLDARLAQEGIEAPQTNVVIPTDVLPPQTAEEMEKLHVGAPVIFNTGGAIHLGVIGAIQDGSVSLDTARPVIEQRITEERRDGVIKAQADRLRADREVKISAGLLKGAKQAQ
ncbi:EpsD family peptidyl-prolyl cis-trans isomerase [Sphingomonas vulcanisoli]|uniref:EpsD family peptidyl-prolyl cis-trans isomerase n=1 Tax=Sphingomonas vulcanisoli TaxID=1658060 RepID=UPI0014227F2B|nr:EpsD family peptidyl-prolyl cis-trans isomerase [Sphingomonas vulcanisoli]